MAGSHWLHQGLGCPPPKFQAGEMSSVCVYLRRLRVTPGLGRTWVFVERKQEPPAGRCQPSRGVAMTCIFKLVL